MQNPSHLRCRHATDVDVDSEFFLSLLSQDFFILFATIQVVQIVTIEAGTPLSPRAFWLPVLDFHSPSPAVCLSSSLLSSQVNTHFKTFAVLICKAGLSLCKRDAFRAHRRAPAPSLNLLLPPPPLTGEWQLFKCKLSLTNTTSCDTCFNHGNKGAASGRAGAPSPCDIQMTGRCGKQKQQHQRIDCAGEGNAPLHREPPTAPVNQLHF